ncbi:protein mono-ADP-ribosyltransferase PARP4 [Pelomyxa schiedti]|nr:protein mono-ADP-ribosyltransferase PARP4 [Pelomyxa schiedti]
MYEADSEDLPPFPAAFFVIRRDVLSRSYVKRSSLIVLELHVGVEKQDCSYHFRTSVTSGTIEKIDKGTARHIYYPARTIQDAKAIYGSLLREKTSKSNKYKKIMLALSNVGTITGSISTLPVAVRDLLVLLYNESVLQLCQKEIQLSKLSAPQIDKALVCLSKLQQAISLHEPLDEATAQQLSTEFYSNLPLPNHKQVVITSSDSLLMWLDTLQTIRDFSNFGESSFDFTGRLNDVDMLYYSLDCKLEPLQFDSSEYISICEMVSRHAPLNIGNIFHVSRHMDLSSFSSEMGNEMLLFHGSKIGNWLGILSRGLLLPQIVTSEYGVKRTNAGNMGAGLYFSDSPLVSLKYTTPSASGSRYLLICRVALGKVHILTNYNLSLVAPPHGFNSCHGVKSTYNLTSDFDDDEYAIYTPAQQYIQYLVEIKGYQPTMLASSTKSMISQALAGMRERQPVYCADIPGPLLDVEPVTEKAGLISTSGEPLPLESVSLHAKLIDLVGQVVILQEYHNSGDSAIQAKYVFPLDEKSAVVGFECFINHKHIVGVVKEKEQAHKEYKEAIARGDGAYLLDEAKSNVFTVSVGNLPPHTKVVIKITYITELGLEGDARKWICPVNLVSQQKQGALAQVTQASTKSVHVAQHEGAFTMEVSIAMPHVIHAIESPSHSIRYKQASKKATLFLLDHEALSSDFILVIRLCDSHTPFMWVEKHPLCINTPDNELHVAMVALYPSLSSPEAHSQYTLIIDQSASMASAQLQCKQVALQLLNGIPPLANFNLVIFGSFFETLFLSSTQKTRQTEEIAVTTIKSMAADWGSSVLWPTLKSVLLEIECRAHTSDKTEDTNIFILTDGDFSHDSQVMNLLRDHCQIKKHSTRIFSFGIGNTVHRHNVLSLARIGGGECEFVSSTNPLRRQVYRQLERARQPCLKDINVRWGATASSSTVQQAPSQIMTLFNGERTIIYAFIPSDCQQVTLHATVNNTNEEYHATVFSNVAEMVEGLTLHRLCARAIVRDWEEMCLGEDPVSSEVARANQKGEIIQLGIRYSLATTLTSFIAVEERTEAEKKGDVKLKPTPPINDLAVQEKVDELPFCTNWKEVVLPSPGTLAVNTRTPYPATKHSTVYDYWVYSPPSDNVPPLQTENPNWELTNKPKDDWNAFPKRNERAFPASGRRARRGYFGGGDIGGGGGGAGGEIASRFPPLALGDLCGSSDVMMDGICDINEEEECLEENDDDYGEEPMDGDNVAFSKDAPPCDIPLASSAAQPASTETKPNLGTTPPSNSALRSLSPQLRTGKDALDLLDCQGAIIRQQDECLDRIETNISQTRFLAASMNRELGEHTRLLSGSYELQRAERMQSAGCCFIATAAYGTDMDPRIDTLRRFRDTTLHKHSLGRAFTRFYYATSPPFAKWLTQHPWARLTVRILLLPLVTLLDHLGYNPHSENSPQDAAKTLLTLLAFLSFLGLAVLPLFIF